MDAKSLFDLAKNQAFAVLLALALIYWLPVVTRGGMVLAIFLAIAVVNSIAILLRFVFSNLTSKRKAVIDQSENQ